MEYILKSALTLSLLYSLFFFFLRKETFHRFNRWCLLFTLAASLLLPLAHVTLTHTSAVNEAVIASTSYITTLPAIVVTADAEAPLFTWSNVLAGIYWIGLCIMLLYLALQIIQTYQIMQGGLRHTDQYGNTVILKEDVKSPFSIFHFIIMSVDDYENQRRNILTHEQEHIRMRHSYDLLLLEVVKVLQWFNPFVWFLEIDLKAIHEYQADEAVINQGIDAKQYQQLLVVKAVGNRLQPFANNLRRGSLKKRITMMYQKKSNRWMLLKALFIIPATCFAIYAFATPERVAEAPETTVAPKDSIYNVPEKLPAFQGGDNAMYAHISKTMKYPKIATECGVQGRVTARFVVETDGTVSEVNIFSNKAGVGEDVRDVEGEDPNITVTSYTKKESEKQYLSRAEYNTARKALEEEVVRVILTTSGKWQPGEDKGKKVRCSFNVPINFRLS